ncbi:MAG: regulatory iron-sulfur-containing complex subunit RicT [Bacilli bacterium]|nr:regulatory iron-sulfur-containing complex subunit RicT [Bacilli bacterium]
MSENNQQQYVVSIAFLPSSKAYYFSSETNDLKPLDFVVVETIRGLELGQVVKDVELIEEVNLKFPLKPIVRKATEEDIKQYYRNVEDAKEAFKVAEECIANLKLDMRLLSAEYTLDHSKVNIVYVSEARVDFRELLKDLASKLKCRIELRQIGTRDRAKVIGGIGTCGLPLCCSSFLGEFDGISINMAKNQFLALNIQKLSGHCGKLICCLKYEDDLYTELRKGLPKINQKVKYNGIIYKVTSINVLTNNAHLEHEDESLDLKLDDLIRIYKIDKEQQNG